MLFYGYFYQQVKSVVSCGLLELKVASKYHTEDEIKSIAHKALCDAMSESSGFTCQCRSHNCRGGLDFNLLGRKYYK